MNHISFVLENEFNDYYKMFKQFCPPPLTVPKGTVLCTQGFTSDWMYYLIDGIAKVYITNHDGNERLIDFMKNHTIIGMDCIIPGSKSVVSISCVTDIHVLPFNWDILKTMISTNSQFAQDLILYYGKVLRQVSYISGTLGISNLVARLANFLLLFEDSPDFQNYNKIKITQDEIASAINISRAQVAKILSLFRKEEILETGNRFIIVKDIEALNRYSLSDRSL